MGKYKHFFKQTTEVIDEILGTAHTILTEWKPSKTYVSKKEAHAAIIGFGLGLINGVGCIANGEPLRDHTFGPNLYEWLCDLVKFSRDDREAFIDTVNEYIDKKKLFKHGGEASFDDEDVAKLEELVKMLLCDDEDEED